MKTHKYNSDISQISQIIDILVINQYLEMYIDVVKQFNRYKNRLSVLLSRNINIKIMIHNVVLDSYIKLGYFGELKTLSDWFNLVGVDNMRYNIIRNYINGIKRHLDIMINKDKFSIENKYDIKDDGLVFDCNDNVICSICYDEILIGDICVDMIRCNKCKKFIGHLNCILNYIIDKKKNNIIVRCVLCRE